MAAESGPADLLRPDIDQAVARGADLWEGLREARVLITGGTGFFGRWLVGSLLEANRRHSLRIRVLVLTRDPGAFERSTGWITADPAVTLVGGDMGSFNLPPGGLDFVIHAATEPVGAPGTFDPLDKFEADLDGTRRVLAVSRERHARRMLLTSSGAVYGRQPPDLPRIAESYSGAPDAADASSAYAQAKRASEFICAAASAGRGPETVIARGFAFVGPFLPLNANYAVGNFLADAMAGRQISIAGDGTPLRSYLYAGDMAFWLWTILLRGRSGRAYNVGSDAAISIRELAELVRDVAAPVTRVVLAHEPRPGVAAERYVPSIARARDELGLEPWTPLRRALERTVAWHRGLAALEGKG